MNARRQIIAALSEDSYGGIAALSDVDHAVQLVDSHAAEVLAEVTNPADAATLYADRLCICDETPHPTWCPASIPTDQRITEIRNGVGGPLTARELTWMTGAAARHELHVTGSRGGHWPLTDDLPGALLLVSQYLAATTAVIERAGLVEEQATEPDFFQPGRTYTREHHGRTIEFLVRSVDTPPDSTWQVAFGFRRNEDGDWEPTDSDDLTGWTDTTPQCPEALYSPETDVLRRCVQRAPHDWHEAEGGVQWRHPAAKTETEGR